MFKNTFQSGFLSIMYSIGSKPLQIWDKKVRLPAVVLQSLSSWVFPFPPPLLFFFELPNLRTFSDRTTTAVAFTL